MHTRFLSRAARLVLAVIVAVSMIAIVAPAAGAVETTYHIDPVNGDDTNAGTSAAEAFETLAHAVSVAVAGDTIVAGPGTYSVAANGESFPIDVPPGVTIESAQGPDSTIIDCANGAGAFRIFNPTQNTSVTGFTVKDGNTMLGSGVYIVRNTHGSAPGWPLIQDCVFNGCDAFAGGAISASGVSEGVVEPTIVGNDFVDCTAAPVGGALALEQYAYATTADNLFLGCEADEGGAVGVNAHAQWTSVRDEFEANEALDNDGGAVRAAEATVTIEGGRFFDNEAVQDGGALWFVGPDNQQLRVTQSLFTQNRTSDDGGALYVSDGDVTIENCVIDNNACAGGGGAAFIEGEESTCDFTNNTVVGNTSSALAGFEGVYFDGPSSFVVANSIFWGHDRDHDVGGTATIRYSCTETSDALLAGEGVTVGAGMVHDDPRFFDDQQGDLRLEVGSPCIDSARAADAPARDIDGTVRPADGDGDGTAVDDMGAWERPTLALDRLFGIDRYATAAEVAVETFGQADMAVLASGQNFPDALSAAGLCGAYEAPLLLTRTASLPDVTTQALADLGVTHVIIVGGTGAVSAAVEAELGDYEVMRIAGIDRYETSALIAEEIAAASEGWFSYRAFIARGDAFPDALAVSPYAYSDISPILLVRPTTLPDVTRAALEDLNIEQAFVCGGTGAVSEGVKAAVDATIRTTTSDPNVTSERWGGIDRYATAVEVASGAEDEGFGSFDYVGIATGSNFPDALAGGVGAGANQGVVLLTRTDALPQATADELAVRGPQVLYCDIFGGDGAVMPAVKDAVFTALGW